MTVRVIAVSAASLIMALNINTFINISVPYTIINVLINAIPVYIGFKFIGKRFTLLSCWVIVLTSVLTDILPSWVITQDTLLISIFGGLINGFAISVCLLADSTSGGTDFVAIYLSEKKGIDSFHIPLIINACILCAAGLLFGWDKALYSILFQYASTAVIRTLYRKFQQATLFIVTNHAKEIADVIYKTSNHGATIFEGEGAFEHCERRVVYSVISSAESGKVTKAIKETDPEAFVNVLKTERVLGRFYQRPAD